ncbi:LAME_0G04148g1_1 [Lachancea meyersii CBS 8951]|uniref:LAME_0G04148g1_1 n=1 Tax=Lachancea meyersii CBS 8951 TaxID=1266667 RepID=A0A1G4K6X7_9SACH|nr:LAME_0G04148g1_1 [Lachancea meyersii CBS 8951]
MLLEDIPRWATFTAISSFLCILGSVCVPLITLFFCKNSTVNSRLLNYGLSLSAGSMMTTSLNKLLPKTEKEERLSVFLGFVAGVTVSFLLNFVVHAYTSESLVHCSHGADAETNNHGANSHEHSHTDEVGTMQVQSFGHDHDHGHDHAHSHAHNNNHVHDHSDSELEPLQPERPSLKSSTSGPLRSKRSIIDFLSRNTSHAGNCYGSTYCPPKADKAGHSSFDQNLVTCHADGSKKAVLCPENDIGYDLENLSVYRANFLKGKSSHEHTHRHEIDDFSSSPDESLLSEDHHHHHLETPFSKLVSIGIQTCLVISLHKFPEGFIVFFTNKNDSDSRSFGLSIFLSMAIHNFIEGFAMTLPLYAAFTNKAYAVLTAAALGGGSQPFGAMIGYLIFKRTGAQEINIKVLLSITSGFLFVIALQMFQTAISFSDSHHHHDESDSDERDEPHTLATVCLRWCCLGAFFVLSTGLFA